MQKLFQKNCCIKWQPVEGKFLAASYDYHCITIYDRNANVVQNLEINGVCIDFGWNSNGSLLAVVSSNSEDIFMWDSITYKSMNICSNLQETLTLLLWARSCDKLAVGTTSGNLLIYNHFSKEYCPIISKHSKSITCGSWSSKDLLALGSEDHTMSINSSEGNTLQIISLKADPSNIKFSLMDWGESNEEVTIVSLLVGRRTLFILNLKDADNPIQIEFQQAYGNVVTYKWFRKKYILLGFSTGYFIVISAYFRDIGKELLQVKNYEYSLSDVAVCYNYGKIASCGDYMIKIHNVNNLKQISKTIQLKEGLEVDRIAWSDDGRLLAVSCKNGAVSMLLENLPLIHAVSDQYVAILSGLNELSIYYYLPNYNGRMLEKPVILQLDVEPNLVAAGRYHCAIGLGDKSRFYDLTIANQTTENAVQLSEHEYSDAIESLRLNGEFASALCKGKLQLHFIELSRLHDDTKKNIQFPRDNENYVITMQVLTDEFLIFVTDSAIVRYFCLEDWNFVTDYQHDFPITILVANTNGTKLIIVDDRNDAYLYNAVNEKVINISNLSNRCMGALWDRKIEEKDVFVIYDDKFFYTFIHTRESIDGPSVKYVGQTVLPPHQVPLLLVGGHVVLETSNGKLNSLLLFTHDFLVNPTDDDLMEKLKQIFVKQLILRQFLQAWNTCTMLNMKEAWEMLGQEALKNLDIQFAMKVYQYLGDVGMVWTLQLIDNEEDLKLLCGHVCLILRNFNRALEWYNQSEQPIAGLEMCCDLLDWDEAMKLAMKIAPERVPHIAYEHAQELESQGRYFEALTNYHKGIVDSPTQTPKILHQNFLCRCGIARTSIRNGDFIKGMDLATELLEFGNDKHSKAVLKECAEIFEEMKMPHEAAMLYEKAELFNKAVASYLKLKKLKKIEYLLPFVTSPAVLTQVACLYESDGKLSEAFHLYNQALDHDNAIRVCLDGLNNPEQAIRVYENTKSIDGAKRIAKYFQEQNNHRLAIDFLISCYQEREAYQIALQNNLMDYYGEKLIANKRYKLETSQLRSIAVYFEKQNNSYLAGKYFSLSKDFENALKHAFKALTSKQEDNQLIGQAIKLCQMVGDEFYTNQMCNYLLEISDGNPKNKNYLLELYMSRKQFDKAYPVALDIANTEQMLGNYRTAHNVIFNVYKQFQENNFTIPAEIENALVLLHSYVLVKVHIKLMQHMNAARLLIRLSNNISDFSSHRVPILTSAFIECLRVGLVNSAYEFATILVSSENRKLIDPKYSKKIETVVRKRGSQDMLAEPAEDLSPCPYCNNPVPEFTLICALCLNQLPFCIATGKHITKENLTACEECGFPAIFSEFILLAKANEPCPMCCKPIEIDGMVGINQDEKMVSVSVKLLPDEEEDNSSEI